MTPKEKAQELDSRFYELVADTPDPDWRAKQGALIAIDEIIESYEFDSLYIEHKRIMDNINFWDQVKQELEKL